MSRIPLERQRLDIPNADPYVDGLPLVLVTVGMDHQPFHRLMRWVDAWLKAGAAARVRCLLQTGPAIQPALAECRDFLGFAELEAAIRSATVVACHAGPGSIMMCRWNRQRPVVVPRLARYGEVVDDHQVTFARRLAAGGHIQLAEDEGTFLALMEAALTAQASERPGNDGLEVTEPLRRFEALIDDMVRSRRGGRR